MSGEICGNIDDDTNGDVQMELDTTSSAPAPGASQYMRNGGLDSEGRNDEGTQQMLRTATTPFASPAPPPRAHGIHGMHAQTMSYAQAHAQIS